MKDKIYHQPNLAKSWFLALLCFLALCMQSCRDSDTVISSEPEDTGCKAEKNLETAVAPQSFQFMRIGYFCVDNKDSSPEHLVFNRSVSLKDGFKK